VTVGNYIGNDALGSRDPEGHVRGVLLHSSSAAPNKRYTF